MFAVGLRRFDPPGGRGRRVEAREPIDHAGAAAAARVVVLAALLSVEARDPIPQGKRRRRPRVALAQRTHHGDGRCVWGRRAGRLRLRRHARGQGGRGQGGRGQGGRGLGRGRRLRRHRTRTGPRRRVLACRAPGRRRQAHEREEDRGTAGAAASRHRERR
ncbi:MAG: hypothetical protein FJ137_21925 [Deltaproteobacteria bacterium]|nr:hypothetical protein [Deltaproteobacteria bacterium]